MPVESYQLRISNQEHLARCRQLQQHLEAEQLSGAVLFDRDYILYYTGFAFAPTERPMAVVMNDEGERSLFVPRLELEHARANALVDRVDHYNEYPDNPHPMQLLADVIDDLGLQGRLGADEDGYPWILGYQGPPLSQVADAEVVGLRPFIEAQMAIKSEAELRLIQESVRWGNLAHQLLQQYTTVGASETEVSQRASDEATRAMLAAIGPVYRAQSPFRSGARAGYRGQIGRQAAIPHALAANLTFQPGDVLVTGASALVWGYLSELERTMIIGPPSDEQKRLFDHMLALQDLAIASLEPGKRCSDVDQEVRAYYKQHDLEPLWRHHTGHAIGLRYHEGPFLDVGDDSELEAGMVFTVEPGLYESDLGGFRHSDTVVITESGAEMLTFYPRDLASLTLPA